MRGPMTCYRLTVSQKWREGDDPEARAYTFETMQDAQRAQEMLSDITAPFTDDLFCSSVIDEVWPDGTQVHQ